MLTFIVLAVRELIATSEKVVLGAVIRRTPLGDVMRPFPMLSVLVASVSRAKMDPVLRIPPSLRIVVLRAEKVLTLLRTSDFETSSWLSVTDVVPKRVAWATSAERNTVLRELVVMAPMLKYPGAVALKSPARVMVDAKKEEV